MKLKNIALISLMTIVILLTLNMNVFAKTVVVNTDTLKFRKEASGDCDVIKLLDNGQKLEYLDETGDWYKVKLGETTGYVSKKYTKLIDDEKETKKEEPTPTPEATPTPAATPTPEKTSEETKTAFEKEMKLVKDGKIYILPLINATVLEDAKKDNNVKVLSVTGKWAYVETDNNMGWIRTEALGDSSIVSDDIDVNNKQEEAKQEENNKEEETDKKEEPATDKEITPKVMYVNYSSVNIRKGPGMDFESVGGAVQNDTVKVIAENGDWYKVQIDETTGYIAKRLLSDKQTEVTSRSSTDRNTNQTTEVATTQTAVGSSKGQEVVNFAKKYLGCKYVYGGSGPSTFDCSGFTMFVFKNFGVSLSHSATAQSKVGTYVAKENLQPGDLVFFKDYQTMDGIGHCGIYIGDGNFIHASSGEGYCVKISTLLSGSYLKRYETARRIF